MPLVLIGVLRNKSGLCWEFDKDKEISGGYIGALRLILYFRSRAEGDE